MEPVTFVHEGKTLVRVHAPKHGLCFGCVLFGREKGICRNPVGAPGCWDFPDGKDTQHYIFVEQDRPKKPFAYRKCFRLCKGVSIDLDLGAWLSGIDFDFKTKSVWFYLPVVCLGIHIWEMK